MKVNAWKAGTVIDLKTGEKLVRSRSIKSGPSLVVKSYVDRQINSRKLL